MGTTAKSEDPDEMLHIAAFHQGLHCLVRLKPSPKKKKISGNYNLLPLNIYNEPFQVYCIISGGRAHLTKG